ncbi:hypothetical protein QTP88_016917 [Uroleucon formosanum]
MKNEIEDKFNKLFDESVNAAQEFNILVPCVAKLLQPQFLCQTVNEKDEIRRQYFEIIDTIIQEINYTFDENKEKLISVDACDPNSSNFVDIEKLKYLVNIYIRDNMCNIEAIASQSILVKNMFENTPNIVELHKELTVMKPALQEINEVITRVLVIPVTSATAERSFSAIRRIKTYLRSTMISERLHNSAILSIEGDLSGQLIQDPTSVIDEISMSKNRRLSFSL